MTKDLDPKKESEQSPQKQEKSDIEALKDKLLEKIEAEPPASLENIPAETRAEVVKDVIGEAFDDSFIEVTVSQFSAFRGPMPHPQLLKQYNEVHPGFSDALLTDFVEQGQHRRTLEQAAVTGQLKESRRGQVFALILSLLVVGLGAAVLLIQGTVGIGLSLVFGPLVTLVGLHLGGKKRQRKNLEEKE